MQGTANIYGDCLHFFYYQDTYYEFDNFESALRNANKILSTDEDSDLVLTIYKEHCKFALCFCDNNNEPRFHIIKEVIK